MRQGQSQAGRVGGRPAGDRQGCIRIWITEVIQVLRRHPVAHQGGIWGPGSPPVSAPPYQVCAGGAAEQDVCRTLTIIRSSAWLCDFTQPALITCYCLQKVRICDVCRTLTIIRSTAWLCDFTQPALITSTCYCLQKARIFFLFFFFRSFPSSRHGFMLEQ